VELSSLLFRDMRSLEKIISSH